ncbi:MAG: VWA domain-containing protein [Planctomycetota bacterium]|nr:MAG: VWA domain-containing protein [Planctomycetota bacterium]
MHIRFFTALRAYGVRVSLREWLAFAEALSKGATRMHVLDYYHLARTALVKDERQLDRFDRAFATFYEGLEQIEDPLAAIPQEWLDANHELMLSPEQIAELEEMGGWDELLETLKKRLEEQGERHEGGSKWIGTGGTSPFGAYGAHGAGIRIGQHKSRLRRAVKVWDKREFRDLDDNVELGTRAMKLALRKLRQLGRSGDTDELDIDGTVRGTAANAGWLQLAMQPERSNRTKILLLLDNGGSMDDHVKIVERLFSAVRAEFGHLETYYFHNCLYESVWQDNARRWTATTDTNTLLHTYGNDWRCVFVGDASMSPYEIVQPGGSVEHWNEESGETWLRRFSEHFERMVWINPVPRDAWDWTPSISMLRKLMSDRMVPLNLSGIEEAVRLLQS